MSVQERPSQMLPGRAGPSEEPLVDLLMARHQEPLHIAFRKAFQSAVDASQKGYITGTEAREIQRDLMAIYVQRRLSDMVDDLAGAMFPLLFVKKRKGFRRSSPLSLLQSVSKVLLR